VGLSFLLPRRSSSAGPGHGPAEPRSEDVQVEAALATDDV